MKIFLIFLILPVITATRRYGVDTWKAECTSAGRFDISYCTHILGFKSFWRQNSISWWPEQTKNMTYLELKKHCDDYFVCMSNTGCYKDYVNYQELDKCIDDAFEMGPMSYCENTLRDILKEAPANLSSCVVEYLNDKNPEKFDCLSINERGKCFLKDVEKYCEPKLLPMYKEHQDLRLFNRACDGRLRYKDWDYSGGQDYALKFTPGGVKVSDANRGILKHEDVKEEDGEETNSTIVSDS
ncbi:unnamed protein product [Caenorhabditis brenneri]